MSPPAVPSHPDSLDVRGTSVPASVLSPPEEYEALREGWGILPAPFDALVEVTGEDRRAFLQNLLTQDVQSLAPGQTRPAAQADRRGHLEADLWIQEAVERFWVRVPAPRVTSLLATWDKYRITEQVEWRLREDVRAYLIVGPGVGSHVPRSATADPIEERSTAASVAFERALCRLDGREITEHDSCVFVHREDASAFEAALAALPEPPTRVGWRAFNRMRIEAGRAWDGIDIHGDRIVPETGLGDRIDYRKGCYLGQETLARLHYLGRPNWTLTRFALSEAPDRVAPVDLFDDQDRRSGWLTSWEVEGACSCALGYVHRRVMEAPEPLRAAGGRLIATVSA